ncbi:MAG: NUDIX hydrolase [Alicyclobacillus sp.]|nr:NUDIX hydrolase [Alicyclobacillus sp.]
MDKTRHSLYEQTNSDKVVFKGRIVELHELQVTLPNGRVASREVVRHPGAVAILAEPAPEQLLFVEQFRKAPDAVILEIPAGKLDPEESPVDCARRELEEETGYRAAALEQVAAFYTSPGFADEYITLFFASGLTKGDMKLDEDEFLNLHVLTRADVEARLAAGAFKDAKTLIGVQWWLLRDLHGCQSQGSAR